jgi:hypothetical protein
VEVKEPSAKIRGSPYHRRRQGKFNTTHKQPQLVRTSTKEKKKKGGFYRRKKILAASFESLKIKTWQEKEEDDDDDGGERENGKFPSSI